MSTARSISTVSASGPAWSRAAPGRTGSSASSTDLYEQQPEWTQGRLADIAENLRRIGRTAGLSNEELDACLTNQPMAEALLATYEANTAVHDISGTPTLVINDVMH
jgi:protein-disulfide isomerase-like protein with CxxC motif